MPALLALLSPSADAQVHTPYQPEQQALTQAEEHFQHGRFRLAAQSARPLLYNQTAAHPPLFTETDQNRLNYYLSAALLHVDAVGAADTAAAVMNSVTNRAWKERTALGLARQYFEKGLLAQAIPLYEAAGIANLSNSEIADAKFELAYCYFTANRFAEAEPRFAAIKDLPADKYYNAGNYYYGLLAYNRGNYAAAMQSFLRIADLPEYKSIVPYYIAELQYFSGDKATALETARGLLSGPQKQYYDKELHQLAGQVLFEQKDYAAALPYFEYYHSQSEKVRKEELYELAYTYYKLNDIAKAIPPLKSLSSTQDSLGQTAMYLLGDCCMKTNDKRGARSAFGLCAAMRYNPALQEAALLLHGKLSWEAGYNDDAAASITALLTDFPASSFTAEARTIRSDLFARTANYEAAYNALQSNALQGTALQGTEQNGGTDYQRVFQRAAFGYGLQQLKAGKLATADSLLAEALQWGTNKELTAGALFWQAEVAYRQQRFADAKNLEEQFLATLATRSATTGADPAQAQLTLGYALMELHDYPAARRAFAKAREGGNSTVATLAAIREADAALMAKDLKGAAALYQTAARGTTDNSSYAQLQQAVLLGLAGKKDEQRRLLEQLINYSNPYSRDATMELAGMELEEGRPDETIRLLLPIRMDAASYLAPKAWLKTAQAYQQKGDTARAEEAYKKIISTYAAAEERDDALQSLKSYYIQQGAPQQYVQLLEDNKLPPAETAELDSAFYAAAESRFAEGDWAAAGAAFNEYIRRYPAGFFSLKAHYYLAESYYRTRQYPEALAAYQMVLQAPPSEFAEGSALQAAAIAEGRNESSQAAVFYLDLLHAAQSPANRQTAYAGLMHNLMRTGDTTAATRYADSLLAQPEPATPQLLAEAKTLTARRTQQTDPAAALVLWQELKTAKDPAIAAEARWQLAAALLAAGRLPEAEAAASANARQSEGNDYWVMNSYLLLADVLTAQKDVFNARATLQSLVKNGRIPELVAKAQARLAALDAAENNENKSTPE